MFFLALGVAALKIIKKFISKIIRTAYGGEAFDNFLIQFSYNFEAAGRPLFFFGVAALKIIQKFIQKIIRTHDGAEPLIIFLFNFLIILSEATTGYMSFIFSISPDTGSR